MIIAYTLLGKYQVWVFGDMMMAVSVFLIVRGLGEICLALDMSIALDSSFS